MRTTLMIFSVLTIISCSNISTNKNDKQTDRDSLKKIALAHDTVALLRPITKELLVTEMISDSEIVVFNEKCVIFSGYSDIELAEMEKKSKNANEWEAFYDDYSHYANEAYQFLYEKTKIKSETKKKYIQFLLTSGEKITVDRYKSAGLIFFFNPQKGVKLCDTFGFESEKYSDY